MKQPEQSGDSTVRIRSFQAGDLPEVAALFDRLSDVSVYHRFFSPRRAGPAFELRYLATVDGCAGYVLVAEYGDRVVGLARYHRTEPGHAVVGIVVDDAWQHRGVGRRLLVELSRAGRGAGITTFDVTVLGENAAGLGLLRRMSPQVALHVDHGVMEASVALVG
jgi:ribosomal protein S18 acetylase RimI-like enzyme